MVVSVVFSNFQTETTPIPLVAIPLTLQDYDVYISHAHMDRNKDQNGTKHNRLRFWGQNNCSLFGKFIVTVVNNI